MNNDKMTENKDITVEEHVAITREDAFEFLFTNEKLQNFVKQHNMIFIDGYFVIAAPKYIERSQDGKKARIQLTKWARENLASCSINICKVHRNIETEIGSVAYSSKIQFPDVSINDNGNDNGDNSDNGKASDDNAPAGIIAKIAKHHPNISNLTAIDWYRLAADNGKDAANKVTSGIIAKNAAVAAASMVGNVAAAAVLFPFAPLINLGSVVIGSASKAREAAKKFLEEAYDKELSEIDRRILLLNSDYVAVLNESLEMEESKGIHSKLHDVTSDDVYFSALEFLFAEEYAMERDLDKRLGNPDMTLSNCLWSVMELKGFDSVNIFWDRTLLHKNYYYDIKNDHFNNPTIETLMAICVGLGLSLHVVEKILSKAGFVLNR